MKQKEAWKMLSETLAQRGVDVKAVQAALGSQRVETPSWAYGDSGTRFGVFKQAGAAGGISEKLEDAAQVHRLTGITPSVAVHAGMDLGDKTAAEMLSHAASLGMEIGSVNPTLFGRQEYKYGSVGNPDKAVQDKAVEHMLASIEIMRHCGSKYLSVWLADGMNFPGQDDMRSRKRRIAGNLKKVHDALDEGMEMLLEYKFFEPAFYATDIGDWGMAYVFSRQCGPKAKVLVDLGHHPLGTNIEQIVAWLIDEGMLGGFHFNSKKFADDDLTVGSIGPYEFFLIFCELAAAGDGATLYDVP